MSVRVRNENGAVSLQPVLQGSEENRSFWNATPAGAISLTITNPDAAKQFVVGSDYYVDFTPSEWL